MQAQKALGGTSATHSGRVSLPTLLPGLAEPCIHSNPVCLSNSDTCPDALSSPNWVLTSRKR